MPKDPYQYFRVEARDILEELARGAMSLEKGEIGKELIGGLLRQAHTLKGAARVVKQVEMAELAHAMEDVLGPYREATLPLPREQAAHLLRLVDACGERLQALLPPTQRPETPAPVREPEQPFTSVRVDIAEMDALLFDLAETGVHLGALALDTTVLERVRQSAERMIDRLAVSRNGRSVATDELHVLAQEVRAGVRQYQRAFQARLERTQRDFVALRQRGSELRLLPARTITPFLERSVRDACEALKKRVSFEVEGGDHRLDAHVLLAVRDALLHVTRNAVAHGIESESERAAAGKPAAGRVRLRVEKRGQRIAFVVEDDGRGLDVAAIRRSAVQQRLLTPAEADRLGLAEATQLLLRGGMTTAARVSEVAGRGVGLDVVQSTAARLKGTLSLRSEPGRGTVLEMIVPISLESLTVVALHIGDTCSFLPFNTVVQVLRVPEKDLAHTPNGTALPWQDQLIPFQPLENLLGSTPTRRPVARLWSVIVLQAGAARAAIGVDRLGGIRDVVVRPLPALCGPLPLLVGAILDEEGNPQLVLDPAAVVAALEANSGPAPPVSITERLPLLVVDDSLTTRMLEQSILEAAGYQVDLATSGEEAHEKARQKNYALFVVDVDMPGISGFELLERFGADPRLHDIPAILVTSRSSAEDRQRGARAGARAYIVKSEFHEGQLLRTIRELIGERNP